MHTGTPSPNTSITICQTRQNSMNVWTVVQVIGMKMTIEQAFVGQFVMHKTNHQITSDDLGSKIDCSFENGVGAW